MKEPAARTPIDPGTGRRRRGRPPELDRDAIAQAALAELTDFSLAKVARRLGTTPGALYHYVSGRTELIRLAAQAALEGVELPPPPTAPVGGEPSWRVYLRAVSRTLLDALLAHPGLALALTELTSPPPRYDLLLEQAQAVLAAEGLGDSTAAVAVKLLATVAMEESMAAVRREEGDPDQWDRWFDERCELVLDGVELRRRDVLQG
ncbi:TetR/AcrR family transcriptional regulator [Leifsonia aquatica]|uniref:TetR/AcrR family transcriptional regulator n=1 Tax=Leifsonia aquatica TaxID=144185 RepID=UPI000467F3FC|nr:hypothetical protein [Leifsonia aquatica]